MPRYFPGLFETVAPGAPCSQAAAVGNSSADNIAAPVKRRRNLDPHQSGVQPIDTMATTKGNSVGEIEGEGPSLGRR